MSSLINLIPWCLFNLKIGFLFSTQAGTKKQTHGEYEPHEIPPGVCTTLREMNIRFNKSKSMDPTF